MEKIRSVLWSGARLLGLVSLPLALVAQLQIDGRDALPVGWLLFGLAALCFCIGFLGVPWKPMMSETPVDDRPWGLAPALLGPAASAGSYAFFGGNQLALLGVLLWQGGLVAFIGGAAGWGLRWDQLRGWLRNWRLPTIRLTPAGLAVSLVTLIGALFRLWDLAHLPAEPGVDLPLIMMNVEKVLDGEWPIFFTLHPGREGLYMYLAAGYVKLFGLSYPVLRTVSALIGVATIPVIFVVGRQFFDVEVGLLAAVFLAVSRWHIILSRTGLRFVLMPLFSLWLVAALSRALPSRRPLLWAMVGLILGWGFYTYNAWLVMPALVVAAWLVQRVAARDWSWRAVALLLLALGVAVLVFVPLARYAHDDPVMFSQRVATRISGRERPLPEDTLGTLWQNLVRTGQMFNVTGDAVAHINVPLKRQLGLITGALFVPGVAFLLARWRQGYLPLLALVITCLPSALSLAFPAEVPNAGRSSGAIGICCLVAAVPLALWRRQLQVLPAARRAWRPMRRAAQGLLVLAVALALATEAGESRVDYFQRYRAYLSGGNYSLSTRLAEVIMTFSQSGKVFLKAYPFWYDGHALRTQLALAGYTWDDELVEIRADLPPQSDTSGPFVVVLHPHDSQALDALRVAFPQAVVFAHYDNDNRPAFLTLFAQR